MSVINDSIQDMCESMTNLSADDFPLTLMDLNNDCLLQIMDYLDLLELLNIRNVCQRFRDLADRCRHKCKGLKFCSHQNTDVICNILQFSGSFVKYLQIHGNKLRFESIFHFCPNIERLELEEFRLDGNTNIKAKKLKHLEFIKCEFEDDFGLRFEGVSTIETLIVKHNDSITEKFFLHFSGLKCLKAEYCHEIFVGKKFSTVLMKNQSLKILSYCAILDEIVLNDIMKLLTNIQSLKLICAYYILPISGYFVPPVSCLSNLPHLKAIELDILKTMKTKEINEVNSLLTKLRNKNQLEHLRVAYGWTTGINLEEITKMTNLKSLELDLETPIDMIKLQKLTKLEELTCIPRHFVEDTIIFDLIKSLQNLKVLNIPCMDVSFEFVKNLIEMLTQQAKNRPKLVLIVRYVLTDELNEIELDALLITNVKLLTISSQTYEDEDDN